ncbi:MAG: hypothetical protein ACI81R_003832 [Bradymonadia bacterium]
MLEMQDSVVAGGDTPCGRPGRRYDLVTVNVSGVNGFELGAIELRSEAIVGGVFSARLDPALAAVGAYDREHTFCLPPETFPLGEASVRVLDDFGSNGFVTGMSERYFEPILVHGQPSEWRVLTAG